MNQNLITILLSVITLFLSAYLAYYFGIQSTRTKEKEEEKKKLKKLLFHLLIVRKSQSDLIKMNGLKENLKIHFTRFFRDEIGIPEEMITDEMTTKTIDSMWSVLEGIIEKKNNLELENSKQSITILINEFSEINPLFALSLKSYANEEKQELLPNVFENNSNDKKVELMKSAILPAIQVRMIKEIDAIIHETTSKIDNTTQREVQEILIEYDNVAIDSEDYKNYMKEIIINPLQEKLKNEPTQPR